VIAGLALVIIGLSAFTVNERELAIKLQVGQVVKSDYEPGLHFKIPVFQNVQKFPARILTISDRPERIFTAERLALQVDFFVKWRIVDPVQFYTSTGGSLTVANDRLSEIVKNSIVTEFGKRTVQEAISVERAELMSDMLEFASGTAEGLGVDLIDVRVGREVRGRFLSLREEDFVVAAKLSGSSRMRIVFRHMLPSMTSHIIAAMTLAVPVMIINETFLSFLGLGLRPPAISWGVLLQEAQNLQSIALAPWLLLPCLAVIITVLALNILGDGLRDASDPYH
jgi:hypothetical protein